MHYKIPAGAIPPGEYGRTMGGQVNIVTRAGLPRNEVRHNQFGSSVGGPIWKQKHFFFVNTELLRNLEASASRTVDVPTPAERSGLIPYTDANGVRQTLNLASQITPLSAKLLALYPQPNTSLPGGNYNAALAIGLND
jgi:hypothetical protein